MKIPDTSEGYREIEDRLFMLFEFKCHCGSLYSWRVKNNDNCMYCHKCLTCWHPTTDMNQAMEVLGKFEFGYEVDAYPPLPIKVTLEPEFGHCVEGYHKSLPVAICLAALKSEDIEIEWI